MSTGAITGLGAISCCGIGSDALWRAAMHGRSGIDRNGLGSIPTDALLSLSERVAIPALREKLRHLATQLPSSKAVLFTGFAIAQAMERAGWDEIRPDDGLILATTTGQIPMWDLELTLYLRHESDAARFGSVLRHQPLASLLSAAREFLGLTGPSTLLTSACSASTQAIALAALWLKQGRAKRVIVGGCEVLCDLTVEGFRSLQLLSPTPSTPFDADRRGINLSEGAAFFCMENESPRALAHISGIGMSTDGYHMTAPHPEGEGSFQAMKMALRTARLQPRDIDWIHAHGTGSRHNDLAEGLAIARLFGPPETAPFVSSSKWLHGHALGASGAIELALLIEAMRTGKVLPTFGLQTRDPAIPIHHPTGIVGAPLKHILKSTLGFGGTNATFILASPEASR